MRQTLTDDLRGLMIMIVNPEKFQAGITDKRGQNNPTEINIDGKKFILKVVSYH